MSGGNSPVSVVTLSMNNPEELSKTCVSSNLGSARPDVFVVVDSSEPTQSQLAVRITQASQADLTWREPSGVYSAMSHALSLVPDDAWVWFVNSSDWLAGTRSIELAAQAISTVPEDAVWIVGQLALKRKYPPFHHEIPLDGKEFVRQLRTGRIGFPHPSTLVRASALREVDAFNDGLKIAADYSTALRLAKRFGPPIILPETLAVHEPTGFTSRNLVRHSLEKSRARVSVGGAKELLFEPWRLIHSWFRWATQGITGRRFSHSNPSYPILGNTHFCGRTDSLLWPQCCDEILERPFREVMGD